MSNTAILIGNTEYRNLANLACCRDDVLAIKELLEATEKYDDITVIENLEADPLKSQLRAAIDKTPSPSELFFYFTGHGYLYETEFFLCPINFDSKRPNETGLSTTELHTLLKLADANLVVKVIDACNSGTLLIKSDGAWIQQPKEGFKNVIQFASCLDSQNSFTGNPLSVFTGKFRAAALRKSEGVVFYTDIINTLRDEFMDNNLQTPFFVSQHTGREQFVDDAKQLDSLRKTLEVHSSAIEAQAARNVARPALTLLDRLRAADAKTAAPEIMKKLVSEFFDALIEKISTSEFADFFNLEIIEHANFDEPTAERFIIGVLSGEKRADNFVTATHSRKMRTPGSLFGAAAIRTYLDESPIEEIWNLRLNCSMERAQVRITLTPKFNNLQRIILVATCAPSLDQCYIFEIVTQHRLQDFGKYDSGGPEASRRWWQINWSEKTSSIVEQISSKLSEIVREQLEAAEKRLSKPE